MRKEWRDFALAVLAAAISAGVLAALAAATAPGVDDGPLLGLLPKLGFVLLVWLLGWPVWESVRVATAARGSGERGDHRGQSGDHHQAEGQHAEQVRG
jgi:hypothetical protein